MSPSRTPGPWNGVNGPRVLTEAQRQRKRERDRATKREEKIKNQQRLQELEQTKESANRRIQDLEAQIDLLRKTCRCNAGNTGGSSQRNSLSTHNVTIQCSPSQLVPTSTFPYEENNGSISEFHFVPQASFLEHPLTLQLVASPLPSEYSDEYAGSSEYNDFSYESHASPLPYRIPSTPQTYTTAAQSTPTTWSTTPQTLPANAHPYSSHGSSHDSKSVSSFIKILLDDVHSLMRFYSTVRGTTTIMNPEVHMAPTRISFNLLRVFTWEYVMMRRRNRRAGTFIFGYE